MVRASGWLIALVLAGNLLSGVAVGEEDLGRLVSGLSAGDRSVLVAALKTPDSQMMTIEGSANDAFWSALERMGLMQHHPLPLDMARSLEGTGVKPKMFSVTEKGQAQIPELFEWARRQ